MSTTKPKQVRVYLNDEAGSLLREAAERIPDLADSQIVSMLVLSSLRALKAAEYRFSIPLEMSIQDPALSGMKKGHSSARR